MKELVAERRIANMRTYIATKKPIDVSAVKRFCNQHFTAALAAEMTFGGITSMCVLPMGSHRPFSVKIDGSNYAKIEDDDGCRSQRFCDALAARFDGKIETR